MSLGEVGEEVRALEEKREHLPEGPIIANPKMFVTPWGEKTEEIIAVAKGRKVRLNQPAVHQLFLGARAALLEVFCGEMELTLGVRSLGLVAPDGVDSLFPIGERPWNLLLAEDQQRCRDLEDRLNPVVVHYAPPCTKLNRAAPTARPPRLRGCPVAR